MENRPAQGQGRLAPGDAALILALKFGQARQSLPRPIGGQATSVRMLQLLSLLSQILSSNGSSLSKSPQTQLIELNKQSCHFGKEDT